jgi:hypothetical protein
VVIALLILILLGLVASAVALLVACSVENELCRRQAERARLRRTQLEAEQRVHLLVNRAFSQMLEATRREQSGE